MIALPRLTVGQSSWQLPLSEPAAARLLEILLASDEARCRESWRQLLIDEPVVALWAVCWSKVQPDASSDVPCTFETLAHRLASQALRVFAASPLDSSSAAWPAPLDPARCARLSAVASEVSAGVLESAAIALHDEAQLLGAVHNAGEWFTLIADHRDLACEALLPTWALSAIRSLDQDHLGAVDSPQYLVSQSLARLGSKRRGAAASQARSALARTQRRHERHWRRRVPHIAEQLSTVASRSQRLSELEQRFELELEAAKLESLAEFAAGAGHEMNPPLAVISGRAQLFLRSEEDPERRRELAVINRQALRVHEMIADMMHFARPTQPRSQEFDWSTWLDEVLEGLQPLAGERQATLLREGAVEPLLGWGDAVQLTIALRAVCLNSLENFVEPAGRVAVSLVRTSAPGHVSRENESSGWAMICVKDNGPGLSPETRRHAFDPYFSGRSAGRGLGLGLSKCWRIVTNHGGHVDLESIPSEGTTCRLWLPLDRPAAES